MTADEIAVAAAWRAAAAELHIRITTPITVTGADGAVTQFIALVHEFGSMNGALIATIDEPVIEPPGCFLSLLNAAEYRQYDRDLFVETLNDWGWFGAGPPPGWYSGAHGRSD